MVAVRVHWNDGHSVKTYVLDVPYWDTFIKAMADQVANGGMINVAAPEGLYAFPARSIVKIEEAR